MALQLHQVGLVDLLESDRRPTFVVAVDSATETPSSPRTSTPIPTDEPAPPSIAYSNPSLTSSPDLLNQLFSNQKGDHQRFWEWIVASGGPSPTGKSTGDDHLGSSAVWHLDRLWSKTVIRGLP